MSDLTFPDIDGTFPPLKTAAPPSAPVATSAPVTPSAPVATSAPVTPSTPVAPVIPDLGIRESPSVNVPSVLSGSGRFQPIPEWTYKRFHITDVFYSKIGISAMTSLMTFSVLSIMNPPFVQEHNENPIEISKPSLSVLYCISLFVFILMMTVPIGK